MLRTGGERASSSPAGVSASTQHTARRHTQPDQCMLACLAGLVLGCKQLFGTAAVLLCMQVAGAPASVNTRGQVANAQETPRGKDPVRRSFMTDTSNSKVGVQPPREQCQACMLHSEKQHYCSMPISIGIPQFGACLLPCTRCNRGCLHFPVCVIH
jgi:hypothetical protein